eukprot:Blabericola_migrator_1__7880@NODE_402_length_8862_cov_53_826265_g319_i0_p10_GENE_NODE_402_length_8862_cov_53_826265_g319_i0NODE_402_length_8862_cov_53_826265_g319_i0_p10_ORF_typecomplete_len104_score7_47_NODE_402_length_8862_cov_53_826265_g319_i012291540
MGLFGHASQCLSSLLTIPGLQELHYIGSWDSMGDAAFAKAPRKLSRAALCSPGRVDARFPQLAFLSWVAPTVHTLMFEHVPPRSLPSSFNFLKLKVLILCAME